ncbi:DUF58 domain-containing protein [Pacificibacter marinus]|uniref:DUF58 domain-containing protein n=1 Tax=Pacificibacter marinus TaxID=658057 RepID=A0A1Y5SCL6_9RHOB|nr:Protein of unknown function DUF58 [Pacificibacter marinus]SLN34868.1 hypothetical protein PAM7971_01523 [Pacificibacter marinus]
MNKSNDLRTRSEALAAPMPALLAEADHLAQTLMMGGHGRRRAGNGSEFWQYRPAQAGDPARAIDWRRSAQSDAVFVREKEWQAAQSVYFWCDQSASMQFTSLKNGTVKSDRGALLALSLSIVLMQGGERVALCHHDTPPRNGPQQLRRIAEGLCLPLDAEHSAPDVSHFVPHAQAVFLSDFLGPIEPIEAALEAAANAGVRGALCQILDPAEEAFPYKGRTVFTSMNGRVSHETMRADDLQTRYKTRLNARKATLQNLAAQAGWQFICHHTDTPARVPLLWLYQALEGAR